jgi:hypothetical protein
MKGRHLTSNNIIKPTINDLNNSKVIKMSSILPAFNMYGFAKTNSFVPGTPRKIHCSPTIDYPCPLCLYDHYHSDDDSSNANSDANEVMTLSELLIEVSDESNTSLGVHRNVTMHRGNHYYSYDSDEDSAADARGEITLSELAIDVNTDVPHPNVTMRRGNGDYYSYDSDYSYY